MPHLHVAIATHTAQRLDWTLLGVFKQTLRPETVVISAGSGEPDILETVLAASLKSRRDLVLVQRDEVGEMRVAQVRNNAARALLTLGVAPNDRLIGIDGDCVPSPLLCEAHERAGRRGEVVLGSRIDLTDEQSASFSESKLRAGVPPVDVTPDQDKLLKRRQRRYSFYARLRPLGLVKPHKPKLVDSNYSVRFDDYVRVNGFDEENSPGSRDGDDFGQRLYAAGIPPGIAVYVARTYHLYHPSKDPTPRMNSGVLAPIRLRLPWRCLMGLENPVEQPTPVMRICREGRVVDERPLPMALPQPATSSFSR